MKKKYRVYVGENSMVTEAPELVGTFSTIKAARKKAKDEVGGIRGATLIDIACATPRTIEAYVDRDDDEYEGSYALIEDWSEGCAT